MPQTVEQVLRDTDTTLRFAEHAAALPDHERAALVHVWRRQLDGADAPADGALVLALVLGQPGRATPDELSQARRLLADYVAQRPTAAAWKRRLARHQLMMLGGTVAEYEDIARLLRLANDVNDLGAARWRQQLREAEAALAADQTHNPHRLRLALLLGSRWPGHVPSLARASQLLETYLAASDDGQPLLRDLAAYHLRSFAQRRQQLVVVQRERRDRQELEQKLEALKAIELRMSGEGGAARVPMQ